MLTWPQEPKIILEQPDQGFEMYEIVPVSMNFQKTLSNDISRLNSKFSKVNTPPRILPLHFSAGGSHIQSTACRGAGATHARVQHVRCTSFFLPRAAGLLPRLHTFFNVRRIKPTCIYHLSLFPLQTAWGECKLIGSSHRIPSGIQGCECS